MHLRALSTRSFRNLEPATVAFKPGVNLIIGPNGAGKTSVLEAVAVLANLRSFRASRWRSVVRHGESAFTLRGEVASGSGAVRMHQTLTAGPPVQRRLELSGSAVPVDRYLTVCPVFALTSADGDLVVGAPASRRALVDRLAFLLDPGTLADVRRLRRLLRQRNAALGAGSGDRELDAWDERLAAVAAAVVERRRRAVSRLAASFAECYRELRGEGFPEITVTYRAESWLNGSESPPELEESYRKRYNQTRPRDRHTGHTLEGPHRHDLRLEADGRTAREVLSSGQVKVVAAALRLATVVQVEGDRGEALPVIIDDVDAELDRAVFARLTRAVAGRRQLFLSSAHGDQLAAVFPDAEVVTMAEGRARTAR